MTSTYFEKLISAIINYKVSIFNSESNQKKQFIELINNCKDEINNKFDHDKKTLLHLAVQKNNKQFVQILFDSGSDINALNIFNQTPLFIAISNNNEDMVRLLNECSTIYNDQILISKHNLTYNELYQKYLDEQHNYDTLLNDYNQTNNNYTNLKIKHESIQSKLKQCKRTLEHEKSYSTTLYDENQTLIKRVTKLKKLLEK
jgi:hypothetical protein